MDDPIELVTLQVAARIENESPPVRYAGEETSKRDTRIGYFDGERRGIDVFARDQLRTHTEINGPAVLEDDESTAVVPPSWAGTVLDDGTLALQRGESR
jgi:N-methylhydantoinase A